MNRQIKFRAWNKHSIIFSDTYRNLSAFFQKIDSIDDENYILMQYTGLKDKNGKEIYEGDIVKVNDEIGIVEWDNYLLCWLVLWQSGKIADKLGDYWQSLIPEIIGNIYENPELLSNE